MKVQQALDRFYQRSGFKPILGNEEAFIDVFVGEFLVPLPNIPTRQKYIKYHDLHHIITGFGSDRVGEGEMSAWELGTGSAVHPILAIMNFIALATGFFINPKRIFGAFVLGCRSQNLYGESLRRRVDADEFTIQQLRDKLINARSVNNIFYLKTVEFVIYLVLASLVHIIIYLPAWTYKKVWGIHYPAPFVKVITNRN